MVTAERTKRKYRGKINYNKASRLQIASNLSFGTRRTLRKDGSLCLLCGKRCSEGTEIFSNVSSSTGKMAHSDCVKSEVAKGAAMDIRDQRLAQSEQNVVQMPQAQSKTTDTLIVKASGVDIETANLMAEKEYYKGLAEGLKFALEARKKK